MAELNPPEFLSSECYTFEDYRHVFGSIVCEEGIRDTGDLEVTAVGGASLNVNVAAGSAWVQGDINGAEGIYHVENDATVAMTIAANGAGSSRIDRIIASVYDSQYIGAVNQWALEVVQGVAGAGVPAVPDSTRSGWLELAQVTVPASGGTPSVVAVTNQVMSTCGRSPYVELVATAATSIPHNTVTKINLATTVHNDSEFFSVSGSVVTILKAGQYDLSSRMGFATAATAEFMQLIVQGSSAPSQRASATAHLVKELTATPNALSVILPAGETIQLNAYQFTGVAVNTAHTASFVSRLLIRKVG